MKQRYLKTGCLSRLLAVTSCVVVTLTVAPLAWVGDVYAFEPDASDGASSGAHQSEGILPVPDYSGDLRTRPALTGDWGGLRQQWAEKGVTFRFNWYQAVQGIVDGGSDNRWAYGTNLDLYADLDLDRMGVIPGGLVAFRAQSRFGESVNGNTGLLLPVNTYSSFPFTDPPDENVPFSITELNYTQFLSEQFALLVGKITTMKNANEFAGGEGRTQFMNLQFLFPAVYAQLAPYSTLAAGALWMPSWRFQFTTILMNTADSSTTTGFGDIGEGATWWNSIDVQYEVNGLPGGEYTWIPVCLQRQLHAHRRHQLQPGRRDRRREGERVVGPAVGRMAVPVHRDRTRHTGRSERWPAGPSGHRGIRFARPRRQEDQPSILRRFHRRFRTRRVPWS